MLVKSRRLLFFTTFLAFLVFSLTGCDEHWAKRFDRGTVIPNARLVLELPEVQSVQQLYPRYIEAASLGGFVHMYGRSGSKSKEEVGNQYWKFFSWYKTENIASHTHHKVSFFAPRGHELTKIVTFVYGKDSTELFSKEEWLLFYKWKNVYLPQIFPEAEIKILDARHPAVFTSLEVLLQIQKETDIHVPEKYIAKAQHE